ncbi:MAG: SLC13 family permease [Zunongwangia sp.]|uniref:Transport protein n=2 Tax=Zunongwangia profunda TaxID=398743 RepID=D5BKP3_ZUNPS|nr:SLC13 family permease [Zunongwangia profunda]MAC65157.1 SLC13 family permease [Flavobacteriaceae bacterium]MAO35284.1 SLC13 family permease [Zunongwangia sp.]ADF53955.1 transport protein [Zunongwangia profunda SM-A87]MAG87171.1 SLC13 family permease [Flavobacteriaceae bacterium]MAS70535.1 SLC13 family permease [Zunongwangia sp.]|tara:strand:+ start:163 stop:1953 length:1791 start_codon:yes stop_codon:yes gene_type:complete
MELYITAAIIFIGIFLFIKDYFSIDTTSILIMALFIVSGVLSPEEGFSGFNHPATITLGCMFVVSAAIFKSGIIDSFSDKIIRIAKINYVFALMIFCFSAALFSAFINDTAVVAILIPMALLVCRETGINPSRLLIPISFSALFGGTCTLIGTSTNILVSGIAKKSGLEPFNMFEFTLPALCLLAIGLTYLIMVGPWLLPKRAGAHESGLTKEAQNYLAEVVLGKDSTDVDHAIVQSKLVSQYGAQILSIKRNHHRMYEINGDTILRAEDSMKILIDPQHLSQLMDKGGYTLIGDKTNLLESENKKDNKDEKTIYEVMIPYGSPLAERSLRQLNFRNIYYASVLALRHRKEIITQDFSNVVLKEGDMLLLYAAQKDIQALTSRKLMVVLSNYQAKKINYKKAIPALLITLGVVLSAALNLTSILISAMVGSLLLVTTSILKPKEAYDAIEWKVIFMMAGVLSMGKALEKTGGSELISQFIFEQIGDLNPSIILSLVFLITFLSTNILSSKAAAALMAPIVISLAGALQLSEKPFLIGVMFACSLTFMTPVSYPTNTMVYGAGNYKFNDFLKFGTPLNFIIWIAASFIIPVFFPFEV